MRNINTLFATQVGKELEDAFFDKFSKFVDCRRATTYEDECKGTDFFVEGIPVDVTFNMGHKDHIAKTYDYNADWSMAIRTGNNYKGGTAFDMPVMVVALNTDDTKYVKDWVIPYIGRIIGSVREMADAISDAYWDYADSVES